jgi:hypothetical protein
MTANGDRTAVETAVRDSYSQQREAMASGDADALANLLGVDFTLTHMTGYRQSRQEWLADVRRAQMAYHSIEDVEVTVDLADELVEQPVLTARTRTTATIWRSRGTWPLQRSVTLRAR